MVTRDNTGPDILLPGGATLQQSVAAVVCRYQQTECGPRASHCSTTAQAWSAVERSPLQWLERVTPCSRFLASWPLASRGKNAENAVVIAVTINYSHHSHSHCILILDVDMVTRRVRSVVTTRHCHCTLDGGFQLHYCLHYHLYCG